MKTIESSRMKNTIFTDRFLIEASIEEKMKENTQHSIGETQSGHQSNLSRPVKRWSMTETRRWARLLPLRSSKAH